jgi:hypothetical protein
VDKRAAAEIDLTSGTVSYHRVDRPTSFLSRLEPAAAGASA